MAVTYTLCKENCKTGIIRMPKDILDILLGKVTLVGNQLTLPGKVNDSSCNIVVFLSKLIVDTVRWISCCRENAMFERLSLWNMENSQEIYLESRIFVLARIVKDNMQWMDTDGSHSSLFDRAAVADFFPVGAVLSGAAAC